MNHKNININEIHFLGSLGRTDNKPERFGLKKLNGTEFFIDNDGNTWQNEILWDTGWGNINGFIKLPEPNFEQLWTLLTESQIEVNLLGSAELLTQYPIEVKQKIEEIFKHNKKIDQDLTKRLSRLDVLNHVMNHSEMKGKKPKEVDADYQEWKKLKDDFDKLKTVANNGYNSLWQKAKSMFKL
ncbi:hypothetical protein [Winogradskyella aquimaris]|uniref:DUF4375 domain-containing protein n=1 Tax=Winogradskyella aquimaris TaxID=864074 RepID=A0ABU5ELE8_9FLAO|nr:hypothetical protein [Winogradskyella aquimaris]MDY2586368.1 hypothetical protein [Winogradskyella aquimaris]